MTDQDPIRQGEIYWINVGMPAGSGPAYRHPHVVIQNDLFNRSRIGTVIVCALTSNLRRARAPGNVLLDQGEADLSRPSVVNVSEVITVDKTRLDEYIGTLSRRRVRQILEGLRLLTEPVDMD